jgi:hypothetical protein
MKRRDYDLLILLLAILALCVGCFGAGLGLGALL